MVTVFHQDLNSGIGQKTGMDFTRSSNGKGNGQAAVWTKLGESYQKKLDQIVSSLPSAVASKNISQLAEFYREVARENEYLRLRENGNKNPNIVIRQANSILQIAIGDLSTNEILHAQELSFKQGFGCSVDMEFKLYGKEEKQSSGKSSSFIGLFSLHLVIEAERILNWKSSKN